MLWAVIALFQLPASQPVQPVKAPSSLAPKGALVQTVRPAPVVLTSSAQMPGLRSKWVKFTGKAADAKLAAIVLGDDFGVYVMSKPAWGGDVGKTVQVVGRLEKTDAFNATVDDKGQISQGTSGDVWLVREAIVTVLP